MGISSLVLSNDEKHIYFSDSGTFAETSIQNPKGSIFEIDLEDQNSIKPIILKKLAYPTGLVINP